MTNEPNFIAGQPSEGASGKLLRPGAALLATGIPVYFLMKRAKARE